MELHDSPSPQTPSSISYFLTGPLIVLVERGVPLAQVRDLLGHASITTTERYDNQKLENLQAAVLKLESGKKFDPSVGNDAKDRVDDRDKVSSFFQVGPEWYDELSYHHAEDQSRADP